MTRRLSGRRSAILLIILVTAAAVAAVWISSVVLLESTRPATPAGETATAVSPLLMPFPEITPLPAQAIPPVSPPLSVQNLMGVSALAGFGRGWPAAFDYSPDGTRLALSTARGVHIFRTEDWQIQAEFPFASPVLAVLYSPGGEWLAIGLQDGSVEILDSASGRAYRRLTAHARPVHGLAFSHVESPGKSPGFLASGAEDGSVAVWDLATGMARYQFRNPLLGYWGYGVRSLAFSPDNRVLVTGGDQGYLSRWDLDTGEELPRLQTQYGLLFHVEFSPDGRLLASACGDGTVQIWDFAAEKPLALLPGHAYGAWSAAWTDDGNRLATGSGDGMVKIWDPETGDLLKEATAASTKIDALRFSADDSQLVALSIGERVMILDFRSLTEIFGFPEFVSGMRSADFSPDGEWAALASENGLAYVWNTRTGNVYAIGEPRPSSNAEVSAVFSPDSGTLAIADGLTGRLRLLALPSLALRSELLIQGLRTVAFSGDGGIVAAGGSSGLVLMETASGSIRKIAASSRLTGLAFPDPPGKGGSTLLAGGFEDGSLLLWDLQAPEATQMLSEGGGKPVWSLTAGGSLLAAGDDGGIIRIWDVSEGRMVRKIYAFSGSVFSLAISPDGSLLAAGGMQGAIRFWSVPGGKLLRTIAAHNGWVYGLAFSKNGQWVLTAGADGAGKIWGATS